MTVQARRLFLYSSKGASGYNPLTRLLFYPSSERERPVPDSRRGEVIEGNLTFWLILGSNATTPPHAPPCSAWGGRVGYLRQELCEVVSGIDPDTLSSSNLAVIY